MHRLVLLAFGMFTYVTVSAQSDSLDLMGLPLEDLLRITVKTGSLIATKPQNIPVYNTHIGSATIQATGAKNLSDLIEIYTPDAMYLLHNQPRIGLRGIIGDRQHKTLLLVNGREINQKGAVGATVEYQNWDINDIESLDIISGPGSVTYGPGAIAGVINITTKNAATAPGLQTGIAYIAPYGSKTGFISYGKTSNDYTLYIYSSITATSGYPDFRVFSPAQAALSGNGFIPTSSRTTINYADYFDEPQLKEHLEITFLKDWKFWARYTNSGTNSVLSNGLHYFSDANNTQVPGRITMQRSFQSNLENSHNFSSDISLLSLISYKREHHADYIFTNPAKPYNKGSYLAEDPGNVVFDFIENEFFISSVLNFTQHGQKYALGYNFSYDWWRPASDQDMMYMNFQNFRATDGRLFSEMMKNGFDMHTHSFLAEGYFNLYQYLDLLVSGRADKNWYTGWLLAPRIALISELNERTTLKFIAQQSVRMASAEDLYKERANHLQSKPETLQGIESHCLINFLNGLSTSLVAYYNKLELRGWGDKQVILLGKLKLYGLMLNATYNSADVHAGLSHSFTKQIDWQSYDKTVRQGISFSDYQVNGLNSTGNDLYNWSNHITKLYCTLTPRPELSIHADMQIYWHWQGYLDGLAAYENKYTVSGINSSAWNSLHNQLIDQNYGKTDVRANIAINNQLPGSPSTELSFFVQNLFKAKRYAYSTGESKDLPDRMIWEEEPLIFGIKFTAVFQ